MNYMDSKKVGNMMNQTNSLVLSIIEDPKTVHYYSYWHDSEKFDPLMPIVRLAIYRKTNKHYSLVASIYTDPSKSISRTSMRAMMANMYKFITERLITEFGADSDATISACYLCNVFPGIDINDMCRCIAIYIVYDRNPNRNRIISFVGGIMKYIINLKQNYIRDYIDSVISHGTIFNKADVQIIANNLAEATRKYEFKFEPEEEQ